MSKFQNFCSLKSYDILSNKPLGTRIHLRTGLYFMCILLACYGDSIELLKAFTYDMDL